MKQVHSFWHLVSRDLQRLRAFESQEIRGLSAVKGLITAFTFDHGFACVFMYRINHLLYRRSPRIARLFGVWRYYTFANDVSYAASIGPGFKICHTSDIVIGARVHIGENCTIYNGVTLGAKYFDRPDEKPVVGNGVTVGTGAKILGPITIGDGALIGALTFCDKSVPASTTAVGNPMRIIG